MQPLLALKLLRVAAGLSQARLARMLSLDQSLVSRYESEERHVPDEVRKRFVAACSPRINWSQLARLAALRAN